MNFVVTMVRKRYGNRPREIRSEKIKVLRPAQKHINDVKKKKMNSLVLVFKLILFIENRT